MLIKGAKWNWIRIGLAPINSIHDVQEQIEAR